MLRRYTDTARLTDGHSKGITCVDFNPDGSLLATGDLDGKLCIWRTENGQLLHQYATVDSIAITSLGWVVADHPTIIVGNKKGNLTVVVINDDDMSLTGFWAHRYPIECLAIRGDVVASGACSELKVWKCDEDYAWRCEAVIQPPPIESSHEEDEVLVTSIQWIPSDKYDCLLMVAYMFHGVQLIEGTRWTRIGAIPIDGKIASASVSDDGNLIAISNLTTGFDIYRVDSGELVRSFEHDMGEALPTPVLFIHGGQALVGGTTLGKVSMWDLEYGKMPALPIPNRGRVLAIAAHCQNTPEDGSRFLIATGTFPHQSEPVCIIWEALPALEENKQQRENAGPSEKDPALSLQSSLLVTFVLIVGVIIALLAPGFIAEWEDGF